MKTIKTFLGTAMILSGFIMLHGRETATLGQTVLWILLGFAVAAAGYKVLCSAHPEFTNAPDTIR